MKRIILAALIFICVSPSWALVLKEDTATTISIGPFVDATDFKTSESALTLSQADIKLSKNGGAFAAKNQASNATVGAAGFYRVPLDATDTNTPGILTVAVEESGALIVFAHFQIVAANVYDSLFSTAAADLLDVSIVQVAGDAIQDNNDGRMEVNVEEWTDTAVAAPATAGYPSVTIKDGTGTGEIDTASGTVIVGTNNDKTSYTLSADGRTEVWTIPATREITGGTITTYTGNTPQTGDAYAVVAHVTYGLSALKTLIDAIDDLLDTEIAAILERTNRLPDVPAAARGTSR